MLLRKRRFRSIFYNKDIRARWDESPGSVCVKLARSQDAGPRLALCSLAVKRVSTVFHTVVLQLADVVRMWLLTWGVRVMTVSAQNSVTQQFPREC